MLGMIQQNVRPYILGQHPNVVICPVHYHVPLTDKEYRDQMLRPDSLWQCPLCKRNACWSDDNFEAYYKQEEVNNASN